MTIQVGKKFVKFTELPNGQMLCLKSSNTGFTEGSRYFIKTITSWFTHCIA